MTIATTRTATTHNAKTIAGGTPEMLRDRTPKTLFSSPVRGLLRLSCGYLAEGATLDGEDAFMPWLLAA
jgi:hypothetical protein